MEDESVLFADNGGYNNGGYSDSSSSQPSSGNIASGSRWVAPDDSATAAAESRLCFIYADLWRRVVDPGMEEFEALQDFFEAGEEEAGTVVTVAVAYWERVAPEVYDALLGSLLTVVKRLELGYKTSDDGGGRCASLKTY